MFHRANRLPYAAYASDFLLSRNMFHEIEIHYEFSIDIVNYNNMCIYKKYSINSRLILLREKIKNLISLNIDLTV